MEPVVADLCNCWRFKSSVQSREAAGQTTALCVEPATRNRCEGASRSKGPLEGLPGSSRQADGAVPDRRGHPLRAESCRCLSRGRRRNGAHHAARACRPPLVLESQRDTRGIPAQGGPCGRAWAVAGGAPRQRRALIPPFSPGRAPEFRRLTRHGRELQASDAGATYAFTSCLPAIGRRAISASRVPGRTGRCCSAWCRFRRR